jgi:glycosyltransferase involved in cell wall biosynthesis
MSGWRLQFWEPVLSPHKASLFSALARDPTVAGVRVVAERPLLQDRIDQGWSMPAMDGIETVVGPDAAQIRALVQAAPNDTVHIFSGLRHVPCIVGGLAAAVAAKARFGLMSEPRASDGIAGAMRYVHSWIGEAALRRHADFVLAIGRNGPPWFAATGYRRERIFPFAYFLPEAGVIPAPPRSAPLRVGYLGRLVSEKGIGLLLDAANDLPEAEIHVAGAGPLESQVRAAAARMGSNLNYAGVIAMSQVPEFLSGIDILVCPSTTTDDGWCMAASEGLMAGAAVVGTGKIGASICLDDPRLGRVIASGSATVIVAAVKSMVAAGTLGAEDRDFRTDWAKAHLTGSAGARSLLAVLRHVYDDGIRPAPFYQS